MFLNGKSFGEKRLEFPRQGTSGGWNTYEKPRIFPTTSDLHLQWDVPYEPGVLKAVGKKDGKVVYTEELKTTGPPGAVKLTCDSDYLKADVKDVLQIEVSIIDENGNVVPTANNLVRFKIEGEGKIIGVDNGNPEDHNSYKINQRNAFNGLCFVIVQSTGKPGNLKLTAVSEGLKEASLNFNLVMWK